MAKLFSLFMCILISACSIADNSPFEYKTNISTTWTYFDWPGVTSEDLLVGEFLSGGNRARNIHLDGAKVIMSFKDIDLSIYPSGQRIGVRATRQLPGFSFTPAKAQVVLTKTNYSNLDDAVVEAGGSEVKILSDAVLENAPETAIKLTIATGLRVLIKGNVLLESACGGGVIELGSEAVVRLLNDQSSIDNPLAGSGRVLVKNVESKYALVENSSVSFRIDSDDANDWSTRILDNQVSFYRRAWHLSESSSDIPLEEGYIDLFYHLSLAELKNEDAFVMRATLAGGNLTDSLVSQATFSDEISGLKRELWFPVEDRFVKVELWQDGPIIKGRQLEASDYRILGIAAALSYEVGGVQSWSSLPEGVVPEDILVLDDSAELSLGFPLSNTFKGRGKVFSAIETTANIKKVIPSFDWMQKYYPLGNKSGADIGSNGVALWKSYCLGLNPTDPSSLPVLSITQTPAPNTLKLVDLNFKPNTLGEIKVTPKLLEGFPGGVFTELNDGSVSEIDSGFKLELLPASPKVRFFKLKYEFE